MLYQLLDEFKRTFEGTRYLHRNASLGDRIAHQLYEDLYAVEKSVLLRSRIESRECVLDVANRRQGIKARRGDGTFGELVPGAEPGIAPGFSVARGPIANVQVGIEVKILAKAMIKQLDRVTSDLLGQVAHFKRGQGQPICLGVVGINHADHCISYEGDRAYPTDGRLRKHPIQEAGDAEKRLLANVAEAEQKFDQFLILRYRATNEDPYRFHWVDFDQTFLDYGAILTRICREYDRRFA